jgi:hypothetical protein
MHARSLFISAVISAILAGLAATATAAAPDFTREVRPLLSGHCFKCHGPDDAARKGKLRLDVREVATQPAKSGAVAVVPGKPAESELVKRILSTDPDEIMPPPGTKSPLTSAEKETLRQWIAAGAEYREHWAFVPPRLAPLPAVRPGNRVRNGIDSFILARLEAEGLHPSPEADRHTLVRRAYLDLIGLPPTPEEADAFINDSSPDAWEKLVDHLLDSPRYGERWARRWMDLARYADTNGYEKDRPRNIWPWRDWVIDALNADMPFDQFTIGQIAGDLLPRSPTSAPQTSDAKSHLLDPLIATGFHRNTMLNEEGGIDPLEFRFHAMVDRVNTTGAAWLGLTMQCAQCHTHKYDPIPQREYYQVMAFLNNADEPDLDLPKPGVDAAHRENLRKAAQQLAELADKFPVPTNVWQTVRPAGIDAASGEKPKILDDGSALFAGPSPDKDSFTVVLNTTLAKVNAIRLEAITDDALPAKGPGRMKNGNFVLSKITVSAAPGNSPAEAQPVKLVSASADVEQKDFPAASAIGGKPGAGWAVDAEGRKLNANHEAIFAFDHPVSFPEGTRFVVTLDQQHGGQHTLGRFRLSVGAAIEDERPMDVRRRQLIDGKFAGWLARERERTVKWSPLRPSEAKSNSPFLAIQPDDSVFASGDITKSDTYRLKFGPEKQPITAIRLEVLPDDRLPSHGPGMAYYEGPKGDFFLGEFQLAADGRPVKFARASESYARNNFGSSASAMVAADGDPQTGWSTAGREGERHWAVFVPAEPLAEVRELDLKMMFGRHYACSLGRFRISVTSHGGGAEARDLPEETEELLSIPEASLTGRDRARLREAYLFSAPELADARKEIERLRRPPVYQTTLVLRERPPEHPRPTFIHKRGEFLQPTERVEPGVVTTVAPFPSDWPRNRLGLARWLVSTDNPLTARVTVNRQWQAFFGRGLVRTMEDFGFQGDSPTHPELLDWLAVGFMQQGWSLKKLHRLIVTSATYRQSSVATPDQTARDPDNKLLSRGPRARMEAELIRDSVLRASGLLSLKMGGPSVYPPQPASVTETAYGGQKWPVSEGEDRYRRSVYTFMKRTAPFAMFTTFDAPTGESCVARRDVSDTPLQALTLLNDVLFVEASQALGRSLASMEGPVAARITEAFRRCLVRPPTPEEIAAFVNFFDTQKRRLSGGELDPKVLAGGGDGDPVERAAWTAVARALFNLDEAITKG